MPDAPRAFKTPLVPLVPILGIATCLFMMVFLPLDTWIRLFVWMIIGLDVYLLYGMKKSCLNTGLFKGSCYRTVTMSGVVMSILLIAIAILHHYIATEPDTGLFYFSLAFSAVHIVLFGVKAVSTARGAVKDTPKGGYDM